MAIEPIEGTEGALARQVYACCEGHALLEVAASLGGVLVKVFTSPGFLGETEVFEGWVETLRGQIAIATQAELRH